MLWNQNITDKEFEMDPTDRDPAILTGYPSQMLSESLFRPALLEVGSENHVMSGLPMLSALRVENDHRFGLQFNGQSSPTTISHGSRCREFACYEGLREDDVSRSPEKFCDENFHNPIDSGSIATFMASQTSSRDIHSEMLSALLSRGCTDPSGSSLTASLPNSIHRPDASMTSEWDASQFHLQPGFSWRTTAPGFRPIRFEGNMGTDEWSTPPINTNLCSHHASTSSEQTDELSPSLATCGPHDVCGTDARHMCSDTSCSTVSHHSHLESNLDSAQPSQVILGSRYLHVIQQIQSEIASYSLENIDHMGCSASIIIMGSSSNPSSEGCNDLFSDGDGAFEVAPIKCLHQRREVEATKTRLLALLQMVDDQYNQRIGEIHTVISAFHAATEPDPQTHPCFALQTISSLYKSLRERISTRILKMGTQVDGARDGERPSLEKPFIRHWEIQQLKKRDQQLWRPQRGLPERSVSVLRAWMFQNFLHPYPKDAEKHMLAIKSGLTRSQVSNWFINARVRLWKPLIEEMFAEANRRNQVQRNKKGTENNCRRNMHVLPHVLR